MKSAISQLARSFAETNPEGAAHVLERLEPGEAAQVVAMFPSSVVGPVVERLTSHAAAAILNRMESERTGKLLSAVTPKQAAIVLQQLDAAHREAILSLLPDAEVSRLQALVRYPPETAGGMMEPQVATLGIRLTAEEAIAAVRRMPEGRLYYLYVTDHDGRLAGVLTMRRLLLAQPQEPIAPLVQREIITVPAALDREEVATLMRQRRLLALPVVDEEGRLIGVVKHDEVLNTVQEEAFEDLQRMVGAGGDESASSSLATACRRRLPWLCVNLLTAFAATAVISLFEPLLAKVTVLAVLLPIVSALGGNGGAQTLAIVMRGLALREIVPGAAHWLVCKELAAGVVNGLAVATLAACIVFGWTRNSGLALVIGLAMVVNMVTAGFAGAAIPLALKALGRDPAQSSQIFLTTITDIVGFTAFLGFATLFSRLL